MENEKHQRQSKEESKRNEKSAAMMSEMLMLDDTSHTNISEISFPSHVSGLDSFSEFERTLQSSISEDESPVQNAVAKNFDFEEKSKSADLSAFNDPLDLSLGISDIKSPTSGSEQAVAKFLSHEIDPDLVATVVPSKHFIEKSQSKETQFVASLAADMPTVQDKEVYSPMRDVETLNESDEELGMEDLPSAETQANILPYATFEESIETQQRPGLDGSSSDSDDGAITNFARSRIGTAYQQQLSINDHEVQETRPAEERQLAEGDDVFSRDAPGDGGGGGDGSSGHSDSDADGDGGVAIRVRSRRSQSNRSRSAPYFLRNSDQSDRTLPERERPVGDSVPVSNQQWRVQFLGNGSTNQDDDSTFLRANSRSDSLPAAELDSSQDSRLSARFFIASSTPGQGIRHHSTQQNNWMEDNSTFRLSESAPVTPRNVENEETQRRNSSSLDMANTESPSTVRRDVLGNDTEEDTTIVDSTNGLSGADDHDDNNSLQTQSAQAPSFMQNPDASSFSATNPFRFPPASTNPFTTETFCKNPFDDMDGTVSGAQAFDFSGFGDQNDTGMGDSEFKLNSQDANALFDEDEKSFEHSNTLSKLANITEAPEWNIDDASERGEVRLSKYFNAFSEELGSFNLDKEDRPRPNFDDYKAVTTPPALEHPAVLYKGSWRNTDYFKESTKTHLAFSDTSPSNDTLVNSDAFEKLNLEQDSSDHNAPDFDTQTEADRDNYGIRGDGNRIDLPTTNGEAESLLHDIEVGRVSLKGISGVNVSNLAAKIAVATNSDPKFILKLLITLIEAEKSQGTRLDSRSDKAVKKPEVSQLKTDFEEMNEPVLGQGEKFATRVPGFDFQPSSTYRLPNLETGTLQRNFTGAANFHGMDTMKLSDLCQDPTPVKTTSGATSGSSKVTKPDRTRSAGTNYSKLNSNKHNVASVRAISVSQPCTQTLALGKTSTSTSVATIRPVSSVTPLIAASVSKTSQKDSNTQRSSSSIDQQPLTHLATNRSSNNNRKGGSQLSSNGSTLIESSKNNQREIASPLPQMITTLTETEPRVYESPMNFDKPYRTATKHLSSTAIFGDETDESNPTKDIALSPVAADSPFVDDDNEIWKPLKQSQAMIPSDLKSEKVNENNSSNSRPASRTSNDKTEFASSYNKAEIRDSNSKAELITNEEDSLKILKMSGEKIQDILPRFSDIRIRESVATFYPVMTANQTVIQDPSPVDSKPDKLPVWSDKKTDEPRSYSGHSVTRKQSGIPQLRIVVPSEVTFPDVQCVGVAVNQCLPVHNPSSRWIQCLIEVAFYSVNGSQVDSSEVCSFSIQPKMFIAPHTTEDVKVTFYAEHAGVFMAKLNIIASAVVSDDSNLSEDDLFPNVVHIEAVAELPNVEILQENGDMIDFGEMPGGLIRTKALKLINKGRANVPLKLVLSANVSIWKHFLFVDSEMTPIQSSSASKFQDSVEDILPPAINIEVPGQNIAGNKSTPVTVLIQFKAPIVQEPAMESKLGPPQEFTARVDVEVDSKGSSITIGSVLLKAVVGIIRLHAPRSLQALSLSTTEGQRVSRGIPFRNSGNISLDIQLQISTFTDLFSVIPENAFLMPGESTEIFVHFESSSNITVESFLLVTIKPDGPQYEVVLRGTATSHKQLKQAEEKPILLCNKPVLCWAGIPIGRSMQQRAYLRNNSLNNDLKMVISVEGNHSDFQVQNTFDFQEKKQNAFEINLKPQSEVPVHVLFVPSTFGMIKSALVIRPTDGGPKFRIPLHGYGGCSKLSLTNAQRIGENYWIDAGEMSLGRQNIIKVNLQNVGNRPAFVKIVCYSDVGKRQLYPSSHISVAPNDFVLVEKCSKQLVVVLQPTETVLRNSKEKPCTAAFLAIFSGDECIRQLYRKSNSKSTERKILREGPLQNMVFDAAFMDDDKVTVDVDYPLVPNWENFFVSSVSRTVVSLIARPATQDISPTASNEKPPALDPQDLMVTQTPARRLPLSEEDQDSLKSNSSGTTKKPERNETWTVTPDHIVLTAPNTVTDKSTARIQMVNYSDKPLSFEFSWPAQSLIITPSKDSVPPRSQLIVFVSTKPSFLTTGGELPWRGCIYVQGEGIQKSVRVQIREDVALDTSPISSLGRRLTRLDPSSVSNTPSNEKPSMRPKSFLSVQPQSVVFPATAINRFKESFIRIENNGTAILKWVLSSIAPPYFKDATESGDIFRTTYTAFRFLKYSGSLQPNEGCKVQVTFQPRDHGDYSQFWDLQAAIEDTKETGKSRIELRGSGIYPDRDSSQNEAKIVGRAQPILKPADTTGSEPEKGIKMAEKETDRTPTVAKSSEKRNRGVFLKDEILNFKPTLKGEASEMQFRLCNDTLELQKVRLSGLKLPFSIKHNRLAIKSKSFIRIPVFYSPTEPGLKSEGHLEVTTVGGQARILYVKVSGTCSSKR